MLAYREISGVGFAIGGSGSVDSGWGTVAGKRKKIRSRQQTLVIGRKYGEGFSLLRMHRFGRPVAQGSFAILAISAREETLCLLGLPWFGRSKNRAGRKYHWLNAASLGARDPVRRKSRSVQGVIGSRS